MILMILSLLRYEKKMIDTSRHFHDSLLWSGRNCARYLNLRIRIQAGIEAVLHAATHTHAVGNIIYKYETLLYIHTHMEMTVIG